MSVYNDLMQGLKEALDYTKGLQTGAKRHVIKPLPQYQGKEIKEIRQKLNLTQTSFANIMGVSKKTIEAWEAGINIPQGPSQRLLELLSKDSSIIEKYIQQ
ncbi:MAG: helix-turn-helix domain-containing protein [Firmicutes bacterium]|nr:helix-turn-helix domain-containing protein [Bacillota bacterium]